MPWHNYIFFMNWTHLQQQQKQQPKTQILYLKSGYWQLDRQTNVDNIRFITCQSTTFRQISLLEVAYNSFSIVQQNVTMKKAFVPSFKKTIGGRHVLCMSFRSFLTEQPTSCPVVFIRRISSLCSGCNLTFQLS